jgi:MYXO-CTERM domain-containing protein
MALVFGAPAVANAAPVTASMCSALEPRCERGPLAVSKLEKGPADFDYDTGWVPNNSAIQVRLVAAIHDRTQVDLAGTLDSTWPDPITLTPKGTAGQGRISIDDGFEVSIQARFTVTVAGQTYSWTGNIPYLPNVTFLAQGSQTFDPWAWHGQGDAPGVSATTPTQKVAQVNVLSSIINIPGISGGFELDGAATFAAWYDTLRIAFDEQNGSSPIPLVEPTTASSRLLISPTPSFDTNVFIHGEVVRQVTLHFIPAFYFSILGQNFNLPLADLPLALPASTPEPWDFDPVAMHVPLPEIQLDHTVIDVGDIPVGVATDEGIGVSDLGEEMLVVDADTPAPMASLAGAAHFSVSPNQTSTFKVLLTPDAVGPFDVLVHFASNDPLSPDSDVHILGRAVNNPDVAMNGGCACRMDPAEGGARSAGLALLAILGAVVRRRRR